MEILREGDNKSHHKCNGRQISISEFFLRWGPPFSLHCNCSSTSKSILLANKAPFGGFTLETDWEWEMEVAEEKEFTCSNISNQRMSFPSLKLKAFSNKHGKAQKRNCSINTSLRCCLVNFKDKDRSDALSGAL